MHRLCRAEHVLVDGVALEHARSCVRIGDSLVGMVLIDRRRVADTGQDALASAGEARKEVRLNEALRDEKVAGERLAVDPQLRVGGKLADKIEVFLAERVIDHNALLIDDLVAEHLPLLGLRRLAVQARRDENRNFRLGVSLAQLGKQNRKCDLARDRTGVVAGHNGDFFLALRQLAELLGADRMLQRLAHQLRLRKRRLIGLCLRIDGRLQILVRNVQRDMVFIIRNRKCLHMLLLPGAAGWQAIRLSRFLLIL